MAVAINEVDELARLRAECAELRCHVAELEANGKFRASFQQSAVPQLIASMGGDFLEVNAALAHLLGYSVDELLGKSFLDVTHPDDRADSAAVRNAVMSG
ncbi:MAG TPA: PAS domain-containing protein, partial [Polyangiaceae bacterium]